MSANKHRTWPDDRLAWLAELPGFDEATRCLLGPRFSGRFPEDMEAVRSAGLRLPGERGVRVRRTAAGREFADVGTVVGVAACLGGTADLAVATSRASKVPLFLHRAERSDPLSLPCVDEYVEWCRPRTFVLDGGGDGPVALHVEPGSPTRLTLCSRVGGAHAFRVRTADRRLDAGADWLGLRAPLGHEALALGLWEGANEDVVVASGPPPFEVRWRGLDAARALFSVQRGLVDATLLHRQVSTRVFLAACMDDAMEVALLLPSCLESDRIEPAVAVRGILGEAGNPEWVGQALRAYPGLANLVGGNVTPWPRRRGPDTHVVALKAIAGGTPPLAAVVDVLRDARNVVVSRAVARSLAAFPSGTFWDGFWNDAEGRVAILEAVVGGGRRHRPLEHSEAMAIVGTCERAAAAIDPTRTDIDEGGVIAIAGSLLDGGRYVAPPSGWLDVLRWMADRAMACGLPYQVALTTAVSVLFRPARRVAGLRAACALWHRNVAALDEAERAVRLSVLTSEAAHLDLGALFPRMPLERVRPALDLGGIRQLLDEADCVAEGVEMDNCVATYSDKAARGETVLLAMDDVDGRATASLRVTATALGGLDLSVDQVKGRGNAPASRAHVDLARAVAAGLDDAGREAFGDAVKAAREVSEALEGVEVRLPVAAKERLARAAFVSLGPFLTKSERASGLAGWLDVRMGADVAAA